MRFLRKMIETARRGAIPTSTGDERSQIVAWRRGLASRRQTQ